MRSLVPHSVRCYAALMLLISIGTVQPFRRHRPRQQNSFVSRNDFDWKLAREVFQHENSNVVFSPFSIKLLLTLLYEAAEPGSSTRSQLEAALVDPDLNRTRTFFTQFLKASEQTKGEYQFDIGTKLFLDKAHGTLPQVYTDLLDQTYRADVEPVSFNSTKLTAEQINSWCDKVTRGHISELVSEDMLQDAQLVLANVLFLKASWTNSFHDEETHNRTFHVTADGEKVTTAFMQQIDLYDYTDHEQLGAEVLRLPYKGREFSMNIVLPHRNVSLASLVNALTPVMLDSIAEQFVRDEVTVIIPKFRFNYGTPLNEAIQSLGIRDVFSRSAALPMLSPVDDTAKNTTKNVLQVSNIMHKAGIEINEKGTLAQAATEIQLVNKFGHDEPVIFEANRPFLFYILDEETNTLLFVGKVIDPSRSSPQL